MRYYQYFIEYFRHFYGCSEDLTIHAHTHIYNFHTNSKQAVVLGHVRCNYFILHRLVIRGKRAAFVYSTQLCLALKLTENCELEFTRSGKRKRMLPLYSFSHAKLSFADAEYSRIEQCEAYDPSRLHYIRKPVLRVISFAIQFACAPAHLFFSSFLLFFFNKPARLATSTFVLARSSLETASTKPNFRELLILRGHVRPIVRSMLVTCDPPIVARAHNCAKRAHVGSPVKT